MSEDYYKTLEVHPEASVEVIEKAYRTLALRFHPDRQISSRKKWAEEKFKHLSVAYSILKDPAQRREYDRSFFGQEVRHVKTAATANLPNEEEAYFHYRMGIEYDEKAQKASSLNILLGKAESDREKSKTAFETVIRKYSQSKYAEEAYYRWFKILNRVPDSCEAFLRKTEEAFREFQDKYPSGRWKAEVKLEFARFWLLKRKDGRETRSILQHLLTYYSGSDLAHEAQAMMDYLDAFERKLAKRKEKVCG